MEIIPPQSVTELKDGACILDMGQNIVGWVRMGVKGGEGDRVTLRFAESLKYDGSPDMDPCRSGDRRLH